MLNTKATHSQPQVVLCLRRQPAEDPPTLVAGDGWRCRRHERRGVPRPARTTWLGAPIRTAPTDLLAYREILSRVRPDWVVEISSNDEGRAAFLASICELVAHGRVLSIHSSDDGALPQHARLQCFSGAPLDPAVRDRVHAIVGGGNAVVLLGACAARATTAAQFEAYFDLIGVGSYAIVTDTIVNGRPVWTLFGPGPGEAVKQILTRHGEFVADPEMGKYALSRSTLGDSSAG